MNDVENIKQAITELKRTGEKARERVKEAVRKVNQIRLESRGEQYHPKE